MFRNIFLVLILGFNAFVSYGQLSAGDYAVYATVIRAEIGDSTKHAVVLKRTIGNSERTEGTFSIADQLTSSDFGERYQVYMWTENKKKERPSVIDSSLSALLVDFCKSDQKNYLIDDYFDRDNKTIVIKKFPFLQKQMYWDWNAFYRKYPGAGGLFAFSNVKFYAGDTTAIVYYWVRRNGLNGNGALAVLKKNGESWEMEYKIYLWHD